MTDYEDKIEETKIAKPIKEKLLQEFNKLSDETYEKFLELKEQKDEFLNEAIKRMIDQPDNADRIEIVKIILKEKFQERKIVTIDLTEEFFEILIEMIKIYKDKNSDNLRDTMFEELCYKCY